MGCLASCLPDTDAAPTRGDTSRTSGRPFDIAEVDTCDRVSAISSELLRPCRRQGEPLTSVATRVVHGRRQGAQSL